MRRKIIAGVMTMVMVGTFVMPVMAEDKEMPVKYEKMSTYELSIPTEVTLSESSSASDEVGVTTANIEPGKELQIKIKDGITENKVELIEAEDANVKALSTVTMDGAGVANDKVLCTYKGVVGTKTTKTLTFSALTNSAGSTPVQAGTYKGTITFEANIGEETTP